MLELLIQVVFVVGVIKCLSMAYYVVEWASHHIYEYIVGGYDLMERYDGKGSWAVISGSGDGLGVGYAKHLAAKGFNIVLMSKRPEKIAKVAKDIKKDFPNVQVRELEANFYRNSNVNFYKDILNKVKDLDISIVITNAAILRCGFLKEADAGVWSD